MTLTIPHAISKPLHHSIRLAQSTLSAQTVSLLPAAVISARLMTKHGRCATVT